MPLYGLKKSYLSIEDTIEKLIDSEKNQNRIRICGQKDLRLPGFEPGLQAWEAYVITAGPQPLYALFFPMPFAQSSLPSVLKVILFQYMNLPNNRHLSLTFGERNMGKTKGIIDT